MVLCPNIEQLTQGKFFVLKAFDYFSTLEKFTFVTSWNQLKTWLHARHITISTIPQFMVVFGFSQTMHMSEIRGGIVENTCLHK